MSLQHAPAAARNQAPILSVLRRILPPKGLVLEIGSGTGQHAAAFAAACPTLTWQPSDPDPGARASIAAWARDSGQANLRPPLALETSRPDWPDLIAEPVAAVLSINMIHIAPWVACEGLMQGAGRLLRDGGLLYLYGPFRRGGAHTAPSNAAFDRSLRSRNPAWGVRDLEAVAACAETQGLVLRETVTMPANNLSAVFAPAASS